MKKIISYVIALCFFTLLVSCESTVNFEVTFYGLDNTVLKTVKVNDGDVVNKIADPELEDYKFIDWYTDDTYTTLFDFTKSITTKTSVYGKFEKLVNVNYITNEADLLNMNMDEDYYLSNDIVLSSSFKPIGSETTPFTGVFDGQGHTISGLVIDVATIVLENTIDSEGLVDPSHFGGIFSFNKGTIKDLTIVDATITGKVSEISKLFIGTLVGSNEGIIENVTVTNTNINAGTEVDSGKVRIGGLAGKNDGTINNCTTSGTITGYALNHTTRVGGLVGANENGTIKYSSSSCLVNAYTTDTSVSDKGKVCVGGLIGLIETGEVSNSFATGNVTGTTGIANNYVGGFVGYIDGGTVITCYATGETISESTADGTSYAGGLIGYLDGTNNAFNLDFSYATGNVSSKSTKNAYAGGLFARSETADVAVSVGLCYSTSDVTVNCKKKGFGGSIAGLTELPTTSFFYGDNIVAITAGTPTETVVGTQYIESELPNLLVVIPN